jgi:hypothetical protein
VLIDRLFLPVLAGLLITACTGGEPGEGERQALGARFLHGKNGLAAPVATQAFQAPPDGRSSHRFEGRLQLLPAAGEGRIEGLVDWFGYLDDFNLKLADLPPFDFEFVQTGPDLVPVLRGPRASTHPHWEFILEPGRAWNEPGDDGWSRASLPFALQERNANCTHNGLLSFLFRSDGSVSRVAYQVGSETCQYLQVDLWGVVPARYTPGTVEDAAKVVARHAAEVGARLPVKPLEELAGDFPGANPDNFSWFPPDEVSTFGFAIDGVHYSGGCDTRHGPYPYCAVLDLPSYSLAKSIFAGLAYMALEQEFPGIGETPVSAYVPECGPERWADVSLKNLLDMATGNYESLEHNKDEFASYETDFMGGETHALKISAACTLFPRKADPGSAFAYHSSDTYIAGALMNEYLRRQSTPAAKSAPDIHRDLLVDRIMKPLGLSPVTWHTRRTYDEAAQPFAGYGLTLHADDIARLGLLLAEGEGMLDGKQVLSRDELQAALQRNSADTGIEAGSSALRYNNGFWAYHTDLQGHCVDPVWIPLMSGYGGISIALLPNRSVFYVFSDRGRFEWLKAAVESNKILKYCE